MSQRPSTGLPFGPEPDLAAFGHEMVKVNALQMHVATLGTSDHDRPTLIFLHGFPDLWCGWARVMARLCDTCFCVAPDQRGYNLTSRPQDVADYAPEHLLADIDGLIARFSPDQPVVVIGHDWGGMLAAWFATLHPDRVQKLVLINSTHPALFQRALWTDPAQRAASAYIDQFRSGQAEALWLSAGADMLFQARTAQLRHSGAMSEAEAALYKSAWASPEAWKAMIHWYRASPFEVSEGPGLIDWTSRITGRIACPTLLIWGEADRVFLPVLKEGLGNYAQDPSICSLEGIGHNPVRDCPLKVAASIGTFIQNAPLYPGNPDAH
jgi:epoxide hydrolase 4